MKNLLITITVFILFLSGCSSSKNQVQKVQLSNGDFIQELALHDAIRAKDIEIVKELLAAGIVFDSKDKYGYTPLHLAVRYDLYDVVDMLIEKGANVNNWDEFGDTPLLDSTRNSTNDISKLLLCNGANSEVADMHKMKPLHNASKNNDKYIVQLIKDRDNIALCEKLDITIDTYYKKEQKLCGSIVKSFADKIIVDVTDVQDEKLMGQYEATIENNKYCATLDFKPKKSIDYDIKVTGSNEIDQDIEETTLKEIMPKETKLLLYEALMQEFKDDFEPWNANLDKESLAFRFLKADVLFALGSSDIREQFQTILADFFPRYMKVIQDYKDEISKVMLEGHTSSEFKSAKNDTERYEKNKVLSLARAAEVFEYTMSQDSNYVQDNKEWLNGHYEFVGKAYDELLYDENGVENAPLSRRVEFKINLLKVN